MLEYVYMCMYMYVANMDVAMEHAEFGMALSVPFTFTTL